MTQKFKKKIEMNKKEFRNLKIQKDSEIEDLKVELGSIQLSPYINLNNLFLVHSILLQMSFDFQKSL
jgi:hypothetical protein